MYWRELNKPWHWAVDCKSAASQLHSGHFPSVSLVNRLRGEQKQEQGFFSFYNFLCTCVWFSPPDGPRPSSETQNSIGISAGSDLNAERSSTRRPALFVFACPVSLITEPAEQNRARAWVRGSFCLSDWLKAYENPPLTTPECFVHLYRWWIPLSAFWSHCNLGSLSEITWTHMETRNKTTRMGRREARRLLPTVFLSFIPTLIFLKYQNTHEKFSKHFLWL